MTISNLIGRYLVKSELVRRIIHLSTKDVNSCRRSFAFARSLSVEFASCPRRIGFSYLRLNSYRLKKSVKRHLTSYEIFNKTHLSCSQHSRINKVKQAKVFGEIILHGCLIKISELYSTIEEIIRFLPQITILVVLSVVP